MKYPVRLDNLKDEKPLSNSSNIWVICIDDRHWKKMKLQQLGYVNPKDSRGNIRVKQLNYSEISGLQINANAGKKVRGVSTDQMNKMYQVQISIIL